MTGDDRAIGAQVIDVPIVVDVPEVCALRTFHENRRAAANGFERTGGTVDPADDMLERFGV